MVGDAASRGYERGAGVYRSARPSYHPEVIDEIVGRSVGRMVVELGAGTGILTGELIARGVEVVAVEPVEAMRQLLIEDVDDVDARDGTAEAIPVATNAAGIVLAAQAFHWFDAAPALDEIARVLQPGGELLTVWNVKDESVAWVAEYVRIVDRDAGDTPRYRTMNWRRAIESDTRFVLDTERSVPNPQPVDADRVVSRAMSTSFIAALSNEKQDLVADQIRQTVADLGDRFEFPYRTEVQAWRLVG